MAVFSEPAGSYGEQTLRMERETRRLPAVRSRLRGQEPAETGGPAGTPAGADGWDGMTGLSEAARQATARLQRGYRPSPETTAARGRLDAARREPAETFSPAYAAELDDLYGRIANREPFAYDLDGDLLYRQYRDLYAELGDRAMRDAMGEAAGLTGGYGNSYAQSAGQQSYNEYLRRLGELTPELYDRAYGRYRDEGDSLAERYALAYDRDRDDYGRYRDRAEDRRRDRQSALDEYRTERQFDYTDYKNMLDYWQEQARLENEDYWANGRYFRPMGAGAGTGVLPPAVYRETEPLYALMDEYMGPREEETAAQKRRAAKKAETKAADADALRGAQDRTLAVGR